MKFENKNPQHNRAVTTNNNVDIIFPVFFPIITLINLISTIF